MDSFEANTQVFIVRVWVEPRDDATAAPQWRGVIEHTPTRERRYFTDLNVVADFIEQHLRQMGVKVKRGLRLRR